MLESGFRNLNDRSDGSSVLHETRIELELGR